MPIAVTKLKREVSISSSAPEPRIGVAHLVDSLSMGGLERVAVNLANLLPQDRYTSFLCTTREEGPLSALVAPHVTRVPLRRSGPIGLQALRRFVAFIRQREIRILHAHGTALFFTRLAGYLAGVPVIWHDHYGRCELDDRSPLLYRMATKRIGAVITVNESLAQWARARLFVPDQRVHYVPNLVEFDASGPDAGELPGRPGARIVCVANFRPQKDHHTLLQAMAIVRQRVPSAHLLLIGVAPEPDHLSLVRTAIAEQGLEDVVSYLGPREDVPTILRGCDIGVLSSRSEGLPLALLEYGRAGLAVVTTNVGQCGEVLAGGKAGLLVPPSDPAKLASALIRMLTEHHQRLAFGSTLQARVESAYGAGPIIGQICDLYSAVLAGEV